MNENICSLQWDIGTHAFSDPEGNNSWYTYGEGNSFTVGYINFYGHCWMNPQGFFGYPYVYIGTFVKLEHFRPNGGCAQIITYIDNNGVLRTTSRNISCRDLAPPPYPALVEPCDLNQQTGINQKIKVIDDGQEFVYDINDPNSVIEIECISCGENEIDCGDCCLPCIEVFNNVSSIRELLSRIK